MARAHARQIPKKTTAIRLAALAFIILWMLSGAWLLRHLPRHPYIVAGAALVWIGIFVIANRKMQGALRPLLLAVVLAMLTTIWFQRCYREMQRPVTESRAVSAQSAQRAG